MFLVLWINESKTFKQTKLQLETTSTEEEELIVNKTLKGCELGSYGIANSCGILLDLRYTS